MNATLSDRQNQILAISVGIIHTSGIQGFTIKSLSNAIGFTEAAIYRHFKSKNEILCAILDMFILKLKKFALTVKGSQISSFEKIKMVYDKLSSVFTEKPAYVSVIFAEEIFKNNASLSKKVGKILELNNNAFKEIIEDGQKNNEITKDIESEELTLVVMGAFRLLVKNWKMRDFSFELKAKADKLYLSIETLLKSERK
ncbi:MAG: TetR/AcrR family transcriptional regulator [Chlorobi bacterium]|nr:TetR/AcrR family transcriptional regulator [Chlorobiota bacterium]